MLNVTDLSAFTQLIHLLSVRVAQPLNLTDISKETGITVATLSKWISVLEASYIIFLLRPFHKNFGKRLVKTPKVYFYDNGLLSFLSGIGYSATSENDPLSGAIFENMVISEVLKSIYHNGITARIYFIRTNHGEEVDLVIEFHDSVKLIEIKSSHTLKVQYLKNMEKLSEKQWTKHIVYQGETMKINENAKAWNFHDFLCTDPRLL